MKTLPFLPEFHEMVRDGRKTATARSKPYGKPGDRVEGPGCVLVLESVARVPLGRIAADFFSKEGLASPQAFVQVWDRIHPKKPFHPDTIVYFHRFRRLGGPSLVNIDNPRSP